MGFNQSKLDYGKCTLEILALKEDSVAEAEAHQKVCEKPHEKYILVRDFKMEHLPVDYREPDLFELIKTMAGLTVRIRVNYISKKRPKHLGHNLENTKILMGSGRIADVYQDEKLRLDCRCNECKISTTKRETWILLVFTATHVVFNTPEAEKSICTVFYDVDGEGCKTVYGVRRRWANVAGDLSMLECVTCDESLVQDLKVKIQVFNSLWEEKAKKWSDKKVKTEDCLVAIVSHPHGHREKKISIGMLKGREIKTIKEKKGFKLNYDVSTCPGSSGAPVYVYGQNWFKVEYVHSGTNHEYNYSTFWREIDLID